LEEGCSIPKSPPAVASVAALPCAHTQPVCHSASCSGSNEQRCSGSLAGGSRWHRARQTSNTRRHLRHRSLRRDELGCGGHTSLGQ
jgi:hypothetical protein